RFLVSSNKQDFRHTQSGRRKSCLFEMAKKIRFLEVSSFERGLMNQTSPLDAFIEASGTYFDVRSPAEYAHAHIPGAINLPLFSDEERAAVGTVYKQQGQKEAIRLGVKLVGPKLS